MSAYDAAERRPVAASTAVPTWSAAVATLVAIIWLIPIKRYSLPVALPFELEPYRLLILALCAAALVAAVAGTLSIDFAGHGKPLALLLVAATLALVMNAGPIQAAGLGNQAIKSWSYFASFAVAFALVCSTIRTRAAIDRVVAVLVICAAVVAVAAVYEARTGTNIFNSLDRVVPVLEFNGRIAEKVRAGEIRVRASAQHPIALGGALVLAVPLALYLARAARTRVKQRLWIAAATLLVVGSFATISRTVVFMAATIGVVGLWLRRDTVIRLLPLLLVLPLLVKVAAPGSLRVLWNSFTPSGGLVAEQKVRAGEQGSGRIADIGPGLARWADRPVFGHALGTGVTRAESGTNTSGTNTSADIGSRIIFDNQYLHTLVYLGVVGFIGAVWFVWGAVIKLARAARQTSGETSDLLAACTAGCAAYGVSLVTFDAFAFVQITLLFFVITALGLRAHALTQA